MSPLCREYSQSPSILSPGLCQKTWRTGSPTPSFWYSDLVLSVMPLEWDGNKSSSVLFSGLSLSLNGKRQPKAPLSYIQSLVYLKPPGRGGPTQVHLSCLLALSLMPPKVERVAIVHLTCLLFLACLSCHMKKWGSPITSFLSSCHGFFFCHLERGLPKCLFLVSWSFLIIHTTWRWGSLSCLLVWLVSHVTLNKAAEVHSFYYPLTFLSCHLEREKQTKSIDLALSLKLSLCYGK